MSGWTGLGSVGIGPSAFTVCHGAAEKSSAQNMNSTLSEQWGSGQAPFWTYANIIGAKYNLNPRFIAAMVDMETGSDVSSQGGNVISAPEYPTNCQTSTNPMGSYHSALNAIDLGIEFLLTCKYTGSNTILGAISAYNGDCTNCTTGDVTAYGASIAYLANLDSCADTSVTVGFSGRYPSLVNKTSVPVFRGCGSITTSSGAPCKWTYA